MDLQSLTYIVDILAGLVAIIVVLGPVLRAVVKFEDLYRRLIPEEGDCIVRRMEGVEGEIKKIARTIRRLGRGSRQQTRILDNQDEVLNSQSESLQRIETQTGTPPTEDGSYQG